MKVERGLKRRLAANGGVGAAVVVAAEVEVMSGRLRAAAHRQCLTINATKAFGVVVQLCVWPALWWARRASGVLYFVGRSLF